MVQGVLTRSHHFGPWPLSQDTDVQSTKKLILCLAVVQIFSRSFKQVETIIFIFIRSIRAEVVTYRLGVAVGSLHTQQLHGFDELRNDHEIIQNRSAKMTKLPHHFFLLASSFSFRILRLAKQKRANGKWQKTCFLAVRMEAKIT
jgi:hypothetical protein